METWLGNRQAWVGIPFLSLPKCTSLGELLYISDSVLIWDQMITVSTSQVVLRVKWGDFCQSGASHRALAGDHQLAVCVCVCVCVCEFSC